MLQGMPWQRARMPNISGCSIPEAAVDINPQTKKISSKVQTAVKTANKTNMSLGGLNTPYLSLT